MRASTSSACAAPTTSRTRWRPPRSRSRAASTPTAVRAGLRTLRRRRAPARGGRDASTACSTSTTPRRPTSPRRSSASRSFAGGVHVILGGRGKGERLRAARRAGRRALPRRVPDRRDGGGAARARSRRPASPLHDCGDLERAVARRARRRARRRRRAALARLRVLRPVPLLRGARRPLPGAGAGAASASHGAREASGRRVESRPDGQAARAAAARAPTAAHRHVLPAGGRGGDGLLGLVGAHAARGRRATAPRTSSST